MEMKKLLPASILVVALSAGSVAMVSAQDRSPMTDEREMRTEAQEHRAHYRGDREARDRLDRGGFRDRGMRENFIILFEEVDMDGDGMVTQEEVDAFRDAKVGEADTSGDGALSIEEFDDLYREFTRSQMVDLFQRLDANGDGVIGSEEMDRRFGNAVERMDRNGDGALSIQDGRRG
ncbi:MAG: hypothetical protein AAGG56_13135 [Pseudomonadota bacterium]